MRVRNQMGIAAFFAVTLSSAVAGAETTAPALKEGDSLIEFSLKAVNGEALGQTFISTNDYFGAEAKGETKAMVLSFFATYCGPCKKELPFLAKLHEAYGDRGLRAMVVSIDSESEKIEEAKALAAEAGIQFPVLSDRFNLVAKRYEVASLPNLYVFGPDGKVTLAAVGYTEELTNELIKNVRAAVGEAETDPLPESLSTFLAEFHKPEVKDEPEAPAAAAQKKKKKKKNKKKRKKRRKKKK